MYVEKLIKTAKGISFDEWTFEYLIFILVYSFDMLQAFNPIDVDE